MEELMLVEPDETMLNEVSAYREAVLAAGSSMDGTSGLQNYADVAQWLAHIRSMHWEETCPPHLVTATLYVCIRRSDGRIVGMIDLRHRLNDALAKWGGHIGYSTHPDERRKGYAKWMLAHILPEAKQRGIDRVLITCDDDNIASSRTIEANGGVFESKVCIDDGKQALRRYWIQL